MGKRALILFTFIFAAMTIAAQDSVRKSLRERNRAKTGKETVQDTVSVRFPISETTPATIDALQQRPLDLNPPTNIVTDTLYNEEEGTYRFSTRLGENTLLTAPILLTPEEYAEWQEKNAMYRFFRKNYYEGWDSSQK